MDFKRLETLLESIAGDARRSRETLDRLAVQHFGDRVKAQPWAPVFGTATVAASGSATLLTVTPPAGQAGIMTGWALSLSATSGSGADAWASTPTAADGGVFDLLRGGSPVVDCTGINSPPGTIGNLGAIWLPFYPDQPLSIRVRNLDPVESIEACAQVVGFWSETFLGRRS